MCTLHVTSLVARLVLMLQLAVHVPLQHISSQAQASAAAEDGRAAAGTSSSVDGSAASVAAAAAAGDRAAATTEVMDQLAGLQQLVRAEAHKQQEEFDNTLKVALQWWSCMVVAGPSSACVDLGSAKTRGMQRFQHCSDHCKTCNVALQNTHELCLPYHTGSVYRKPVPCQMPQRDMCASVTALLMASQAL